MNTALQNQEQNSEAEKIHFRFANSPHDLKEVGRVRYQVYIEELGDIANRHDPVEKTLIDEIDQESYIIMAEQNGRLIGTGRFTMVHNVNHSEFAFLKLQKVPLPKKWPIAVATRFAVLPEFRGSAVFFKIADHLTQAALHMGAVSTVAFCFDHVAGMLSKLGYRPYMDEARHPQIGRFNPLYLPLNYEALRSLRSPLARSYRNYSKIAWRLRAPRAAPLRLRRRRPHVGQLKSISSEGSNYEHFI